MHETPEDIARLQDLLDQSYAAGGPHLRSTITPERRLGAAELVERLQGMRLLVVATVTADGRPLTGPVDGDTLVPSVFSCQTVQNATHYQLLFGSNPDRVMDCVIRMERNCIARHSVFLVLFDLYPIGVVGSHGMQRQYVDQDKD